MSIEIARAHLKPLGLEDRIIEFQVSSATVELAAQALGCPPAHIAKTLSFRGPDDTCILVVAAGDARVDNPKFKTEFGLKARMLTPDEAVSFTGHAVGGVCPFGVGQKVRIYLDASLRRFSVVYPAAGTPSSAVRLTIEELERATGHAPWVEVCRCL